MLAHSHTVQNPLNIPKFTSFERNFIIRVLIGLQEILDDISQMGLQYPGQLLLRDIINKKKTTTCTSKLIYIWSL